MTDRGVQVLLLMGTVGAGKTAIALAMHEQLTKAGIPNAAVDLDALIWQWPGDSDWNNDLMYRNLAAIWPNYEVLGVRHLVLARVLESRDELVRYRDAVPGADIQVARVVAARDLREQRLINRMPPGQSLEWHLHRTVELDAILDTAEVEDFVIDNDASEPRIGAEAGLRAAGWL